jgi:hypothetical protein
MSGPEPEALDAAVQLHHYYEQERLRKAFAVPFAAVNTWSVASFFSIRWGWPSEVIRPLGSALESRHEPVDREGTGTEGLDLITIRFDGSVERRAGADSIKANLFEAPPEDLVYSKIDIRHGAIGIVPAGLERVVVTSEYPVYRVRGEVAFTEYVKLLVRTSSFKTLILMILGRRPVPDAQVTEPETHEDPG